MGHGTQTQQIPGNAIVPRAREPGPRTPKIQIDSFRSMG